MNGNGPLKLFAWGVALTLVALPVIGVLNGWFASDRWPVTQLSVRAEFNHVSAEQISAAAQPLLGEGFFAIKLERVRDAVAKLPWVERIEARKRWPDTIDLVIYEQQPYARWGEDRLINRHGAIFSVASATGLQGLPRLAGPDDRVADVLAFYAGCLKEFSGSGLVIDAVTLSPRGGWKLDLASGAVIELGREDSKRRLQRFLDVWPRLVGAHAEPPAYVDLRYENGFALRWPDQAGIRDSGMEIRETHTPPQARATSSFGAVDLAVGDDESLINEHLLSLFRIPNASQQPKAGHPESRIPALL